MQIMNPALSLSFPLAHIHAYSSAIRVPSCYYLILFDIICSIFISQELNTPPFSLIQCYCPLINYVSIHCRDIDFDVDSLKRTSATSFFIPN